VTYKYKVEILFENPFCSLSSLVPYFNDVAKVGYRVHFHFGELAINLKHKKNHVWKFQTVDSMNGVVYFSQASLIRALPVSSKVEDTFLRTAALYLNLDRWKVPQESRSNTWCHSSRW
jgi:hypothetical protein